MLVDTPGSGNGEGWDPSGEPAYGPEDGYIKTPIAVLSGVSSSTRCSSFNQPKVFLHTFGNCNPSS